MNTSACTVVARLNSPLIASLDDPADCGSRICQACDGRMKVIVLSETLMLNPRKRLPDNGSSSMGRPQKSVRLSEVKAVCFRVGKGAMTNLLSTYWTKMWGAWRWVRVSNAVLKVLCQLVSWRVMGMLARMGEIWLPMLVPWICFQVWPWLERC